MIEEHAIVTEQLGSQVRLAIERRTACGICGQTRGCGNATWGKLLGHAETTLKVDNVIDANVGERVVVGIEEKVFLNASFLLYVVPLIALFVGAGLAQYFLHQDIYVIFGALFGLALGFFVVKAITKMNVGKFAKFKNIAEQPYAVMLRRADGVKESCRT